MVEDMARAVRRVRRVSLGDSKRLATPATKAGDPAHPGKRIEVIVRIRGKRAPTLSPVAIMKMGARLPRQRRYLSREAFRQRFAADPADIGKVKTFAAENGLEVVESLPTHRTVRLAGTVRAFNAAFEVELRKSEGPRASYRVRTGAISIPAALKRIIVGVHGLDNRPVARPHVRHHDKPAKERKHSLEIRDVARLYNFPPGLTGKGQCIALIELNVMHDDKVLGTGYRLADLRAYFKRLNIKPPTVVPVAVAGGANRTGARDGDIEAALDLQVAAAIAPEAKIVVYFAPRTTKGFIAAVKAAVHDDRHCPSVIAISWGQPEDAHGDVKAQFMEALDEAFREAAAMGITVCCSSGDDGSADMDPDEEIWDEEPHVDFPASSPFVLACGGTKLTVAREKIAREVVWNEGRKKGAGGGGVSTYFGHPPYQRTAGVPRSPKGPPGRGVPDVAGNADPLSGYRIVVKGQHKSFGGTSAVAPLMAGLLALINQRLVETTGKTVGFINPLLYAKAAKAVFRDITSGHNDNTGKLRGKYGARRGWDACSGLGVPDGQRLVDLLTG